MNKHGPDDILSRALETPEYRGRVRGKAFGVTPSAYFGQQKKQTMTELRGEVGNLRQEVAELKQQNAEIVSLLKQGLLPSQVSGNAPPSASPSMNYSCTMPRDPIPPVNYVFPIYKL